MTRRETLLLLLVVLLCGIFFYVGSGALHDEREIQSIRNRSFPLAGEKEYGNDAGMETGDDADIQLINRDEAVGESSTTNTK